MGVLQEIVVGIVVLLVTAGVIGGIAYSIFRHYSRDSITQMLRRHFRPTPLHRIVITERQFPLHIRADLQQAINDFLTCASVTRFTGVQVEEGLGGVDLSALLSGNWSSRNSSAVAAPQYEQIDIGEEEPVATLKNGLWLLARAKTKAAVLFAPFADFGHCGILQRARVQFATAEDGDGPDLAQSFFKRLEAAVLSARCYRGKVLSLEADESSYMGQASGVKVHRLSKICRDQVILPLETLDLLERNVLQFVQHRHGLGELSMATKKGILFYGPPGTGKTHTIRYLAGSLPGHTTFLISAEQVAALGEYLTLARLFQPSLVVIEDVDLIARDRARMRNPQSEALLNKLLNEMDGLREDAEILFILTTNRPQQLEAALSARPGRIDQAIEFPLPDEEARKRLVKLYARKLPVPDKVVDVIAKRTEKVSASFIKELMRRAAQSHLERDGSSYLDLQDVENALDEMLLRGGSLNLKLLGGVGRMSDDSGTPETG